MLIPVKTKIVATLGPSCNEVAAIAKMLRAGLSVARFNMSHGDHTSHATAMKNARAASIKTKIPLGILLDLAGPKIRLGDFSTESVTLENGHPLTLTTEPCVGTVSRVHITYSLLPQEVKPGMAIYLNDGKQKLQVDRVTATEIYTTVISGGTIKGRRGVNIPDADLSISSLTPKDRKDLAFGISQDVDFITLSFVRTASDIHLLRKLIKKQTTKDIAIVAKIETKSAIENLTEIVAATDVVMVARGDLAIEMPPEKVPLLQKKIIALANRMGKPVITATQMLDSMRTAVTPTRAEVSDIANAILDGTDALMLSDETAVGLHPEKPIEVMSKVAREVESDTFFTECSDRWDFSPTTVYEAVGQSIVKTAKTVGAKAIVTFSESGYTSKMIIRYRPRVPVLVLTPHQTTFNQSLVAYACQPVLIKNRKSIKGLSDAQKHAREALLKANLATKGDVFILAAGIPFGTVGSTNMMLVETV